jgi:hypothetical protein
MLFENFNLNLSYRDRICELEVRELYGNPEVRSFEVLQGGITILILAFNDNAWHLSMIEGLHPVVKQDTEDFVSQELQTLLVQAVTSYYQLFTDRKILRKIK